MRPLLAALLLTLMLLTAAACAPAGTSAQGPAGSSGTAAAGAAPLSPAAAAPRRPPARSPAVSSATRQAPVSSPAPPATVPSATLPPATAPSATVPSSATQPSAVQPARLLSEGMSGADVLALQKRLAALHYYPGPQDGQFGPDTLEAVWAFEEVQGLATTGQVGAAAEQALASPRSPAVLVPGGGGLRVEVNLSDEVLVLYHGGQVSLISHVSSGGGYRYCSGNGCAYAITPTGDFKTTTFMPGWVTVPLGEMYNPVFFIGTTFAIHGDTYVPLQPASHGCVRIPMDIAQFFYTLVPAPGTPVYVRG